MMKDWQLLYSIQDERCPRREHSPGGSVIYLGEFTKVSINFLDPPCLGEALMRVELLRYSQNIKHPLVSEDTIDRKKNTF